jgi:methylmalonyl-CoA mutase N-terminal domain/subunit
VVAYETGAATVADPLGGSHYLEWLTGELERQAEDIFAKLDEWGDGSILAGVYAGIESGWFQGAIADSAYRFQRGLHDKSRIMVGVNAFTEGDDSDQTPILSIGAEVEEIQLKRLGEVRQRRSDEAVRQALTAVRSVAADSTANLMPAIIDAVGAYATIGEIMNALADTFGRYIEKPAL